MNWCTHYITCDYFLVIWTIDNFLFESVCEEQTLHVNKGYLFKMDLIQVHFSGHCVHRTQHFVSVFRSKGKMNSKLLSKPATLDNLFYCFVKWGIFRHFRHTHTVHHSLVLCQSLLCSIILNSKNTPWWNIDFLFNFCWDISWMPRKDSTLGTVLHPALCSLVEKHSVSVYSHLR